MNILSGIICLCCSFWMWIYLYGLHSIYSAQYNAALNIFPLILFSLAVYLFVQEAKKNNHF